MFINGELGRRITLPAELTELKPYTFINCEQLLTVSCGSEILKAGTNVFSGCSKLQRISFSKLSDYLQIDYLKKECILTYRNNAAIYIDGSLLDFTNFDWPETITAIPDYAFFGNNALKNIQIPETVVSIGQYAFAGTGISEIDLPENLQKIGTGCFTKSSLCKFDLPEGIKEIPAQAFYGCERLSSVHISNGLQTIMSDAFCDCWNLTDVYMPSSLKFIGSNAFSGCENLKNVWIEDLDLWASVNFSNYNSNPITRARSFMQWGKNKPVRNLDLRNVESISDYAFCSALNLKTVRIKSASVGNAAFSDCDNITDLCIDTENISSSAFGMSALKNVYSLTATPPNAPDNAFRSYSNVTLHVPEGVVRDYENSEKCWWQFLDIKSSDFSNIDSIFNPGNSSIPNVSTDESFKIYASNGTIHVEAGNVVPIEIYTTNGVRIASELGSIDYPVALGLYLVRVGTQTTKLVVK